jgi:membrane protease subunit HflC
MYTVRFTESAVVTTFGKADEDSVIREPGLRFKLPSPLQTVTRYDTRARFVEARPETRVTGDDHPIIVTAFLTYKVTNPLKFFQAFGSASTREDKHFEQADTILQSKLRFALNEVSRLKFSEILSAEGRASGLATLEQRVLAQLKANAADSPALSDYGVEPILVGISSIKLPEETSKEVFKRMAQERARRAEEYTSKGTAESERIKSEADADAQKILAFAEGRAVALRGQGDLEAKEYLAVQNANPALAVFLKNLEFMREATAGKVTLVLPQSLPGMGVFSLDALNNLPAGAIPKMVPIPAPLPGVKPASKEGGQ